MRETVTEEFIVLGREVARTAKPQTMTVRELLRHFGQERRGSEVVRFINYKLRYLGLETEPRFDEVHIDGSVNIVPRQRRPPGRPAKNPVPVITLSPEEIDGRGVSSAQLSAEYNNDEDDRTRQPYLRIGLLSSANQKLYKVRGNDKLETAVTLLLMHDITHIPVMQSERAVDGIITWRSIGRSKAANKSIVKAQDCMEPAPRVVPIDAPLFDAVSDIMRDGAVLVQARDKTVCGIVTTWDIAHQFVTLSEPFLYLEQIENCLRHLLARVKLKPDELKSLVDPVDAERLAVALTLDSLTFGECLRGLGKPEIWDKLKLGIDRGLLVHRLEAIRKIRNAVMHFHPDGISQTDRDALAKTREMLQGL
ncbi:MAG TPA: CBS domain-containing protein [Verrucomicrobiae bacterium]|nr:CBS domain-containing protein [Verrucomicrobiae bacterium]